MFGLKLDGVELDPNFEVNTEDFNDLLPNKTEHRTILTIYSKCNGKVIKAEHVVSLMYWLYCHVACY